MTGLDTRKQRHILFVLEYFWPHVGGVEILFWHLTQALVDIGYRVTVITLWVPGTPIRETDYGVEIIRVKTPPRAQRYLFMLYALPMVLRYARRADLIHATLYNAAIPGYLGSVLTRRPVVLTVHEVFGSQWNNLRGLNPLLGYGYRCFEWFLLQLPFRHYICPSWFTAQRLQQFAKVPASKISVAYNAIDYDFWHPARHRARDFKDELQLTPGTFVYLYFGRPGISKGVEYLIEAVPFIRAALPESHLVLLLARDPLGPYRRICRSITARGLSDSITVLDPVPREELPSYLLAANCIVIPSVSEGFGYSAVEAATIGCPVVTTSGHSVEEVLEECVHYVPPRDPAALAAAIVKVARQRPNWREPKRYDIASHIASVLAVYDRVFADFSTRTNQQASRVVESSSMLPD